MNNQKRFPEEFKIEAIKQVTERGHRVAEVAARLDVSQHSLYAWIKRYSAAPEQRAAQSAQSDEVRKLKAELKRVTEERDILKKAAAYFARQSG
jgi:transposase